jgi:hypothetical protein
MRKSTDARGVEAMLRLGRSPDVSEEEIIEQIRAKMSRALRLNVEG